MSGSTETYALSHGSLVWAVSKDPGKLRSIAEMDIDRYGNLAPGSFEWRKVGLPDQTRLFYKSVFGQVNESSWTLTKTEEL